MTKVLFKRKTTDEIASLPVEDGAIIYNYETGATYLDYDDERIPTGGGMPTGDTFPIGAISPYAGSVAPTNWLICDGRAISRVTYSDLFNAIGTTYGSGDGNTTFNLPNLKGRVITGLDTSQTEFDALGETGGEKTHLLTDNEIPPLTAYAPSQTTGGNMAYLNDWSGYTGTGLGNIPITKTKTTNASEHNNLQPYITLNYIIKAFQSAGTVANVSTTTTTSDTDTYSCNYINEIKDGEVYSTTETKTNGVWANKPIYRKIFETNASSSTDLTLGAINDVDMCWVAEKSQTIISTTNINYYVPASTYEENNNFSKFYIQKGLNNTATIKWVGSPTTGKIIAVVEYTKTTD